MALNFPPKNSKFCYPYFTMVKKRDRRSCSNGRARPEAQAVWRQKPHPKLGAGRTHAPAPNLLSVLAVGKSRDPCVQGTSWPTTIPTGTHSKTRLDPGEATCKPAHGFGLPSNTRQVWLRLHASPHSPASASPLCTPLPSSAGLETALPTSRVFC